jgi:drug/metabolite transporter (DMT)-like permease
MLNIQRQRLLGCVLVLLGAAGFSAKAILIKLAYAADNQLDAITLMALRMLFSLPFYVIIATWQYKSAPATELTKTQWLAIILLGLIGYYFASYLDFLGLQTISAGLERLIIFSYPTFVVLLSALFFRNKIPVSVVIALGLSYIGILLVFIEQVSLTSENIWLGSAFVLGSAIVFSFFVIGSGEMVHSVGSARFTACSMTVACLATISHFVIQHDWFLTLSALSSNIYLFGLLMAIFCTVLPSFLMNMGIKKVGANTTAILSSVGPIITLLLAQEFLQETISSIQLLGTFFVLAGGLVVGRAKN